MISEHLPALQVVVPLVAAPLIVLLRHPGIAWTLAVATSVFAFGASLGLAAEVARSGVISYAMGSWPPPWGIEYRVDALSAFVLVLVSAIGALVAPYAWRSVAAELPREQHYLYYAVHCLCLAGLLGMTITGDAFNVFVFMEIASLAMYVLIALGRDRRALLASFQYLILGTIGATFYVIGVGFAYMMTGTLNMADMALRLAALPQESAALAQSAALMLLVVFAVKAALLPLYFWLPDAYASATAPVAALFAIMTKVGVYALLRSTTMMFGPGQGLVEELAKPYLLPAALLTLVMAVLGAMAATKLRTMTAYLLLASIGTMLAGFGLFTHAAISGSLYYLLHSTLVMGALFLVADLVMSQRGPDVRDAFKPGPKIRQPVLVGMLFFVAVVAVAGLPPLSGFLGKAQILWAAIPTESMALVWTVVLVTSFFTLVALSRAATTLFWKTTDDVEARSSEAGWKVFPIVALLTCIIGMTIFAGPIVGHTDATASQLLSPSDYINAVTQEAP